MWHYHWMPTPKSFAHVTLTVTDLAASVEWYERVLSISKVADRSGDGWHRSLLRGSGVTIGLTQHERTPTGDRFDHARVGLDHLSFSCADPAEVEGWASHFDSIGVAHEGVTALAYGTMVVCRDPDGTPLEFFAPEYSP